MRPSAVPVDAKVTIDKNGQMIKKTAFYVRAGNATRELNATEKPSTSSTGGQPLVREGSRGH